MRMRRFRVKGRMLRRALRRGRKVRAINRRIRGGIRL